MHEQRWVCRVVGLVFEGSIPTYACFSFRKLFVTCFCGFFVLLFRNGKRREVGGEAKGKMHDLWCY